MTVAIFQVRIWEITCEKIKMNISEVLKSANNNAHAQKAAEFVEAHGGEFNFTFESTAPNIFEIRGYSQNSDYFAISQKQDYHYVSFGGDRRNSISGGQGTYEFNELAETVDEAIALMTQNRGIGPGM